MYAFISDPIERDFLRAEPDETASLSERMSDYARGGLLMSGALEVGGLVEDVQSGRLSDLTGAAYEQTRLVELELSNVSAITASLDAVLDTVQKEIGVAVPNPARGGYLPEAMNEIQMEHGANWRRVVLEQPDLVERTQMRMLETRLQELTRSDPRAAAAIAKSREINTPQAVARKADERFNRLSDEAASITGWAAGMFAGAGAASLVNSPLTAASMFAGGGAATARGVWLGIAQVAGREAAINATVTAAMQPGVQAWRKEIGLSAGFDEGLANVLFAAALGGVVGGGVEGLRKGIAGLAPAQREAIERAVTPGATSDDVVAGMEAAGLRVSEDDRALARAAEAVASADQALDDAIPGVPREAHQDAIAGALARAQDPDLPPAEIAYPVRSGVDDMAAIAVIDDARFDGLTNLSRLRDDPELIESAWSSPSPAVREAGAIATLHDEAFAFVMAGEVDPRHAAIVARMTGDPNRQAGLMAHLRESRPLTIAEASEMLQGVQSAEVARAAAARLLGVDEQGRAARSPDDIPFAGDDTPASPARRGADYALRDPEPDDVFRVQSQADGNTALYVFDGDQHVANILVRAEGTDLRIENIIHNERFGADAYNTLGPRLVRSIARQLRRRFPDAETISGDRVGGARFGGEHVGDGARGKPAKVSLQRLEELPDAAPEPLQARQTMIEGRTDEDVISTTPVVRPDGSMALGRRGDAAIAGERDNYLNDLVKACNI